MNWDLLVSLLCNTTGPYCVVYPIVRRIAESLRHTKHVQAYYTAVRIYRVLRPYRWPVVLTFCGLVLLGSVDFWSVLFVVFMITSTYFDKDDFDDPPKREKKLAAKVKALGHKLVVVPQGA